MCGVAGPTISCHAFAHRPQVNDAWGEPNSPVRRSHERLLRTLHELPHVPAVMELVVFRWPIPIEWNRYTMHYRYFGES